MNKNETTPPQGNKSTAQPSQKKGNESSSHKQPHETHEKKEKLGSKDFLFLKGDLYHYMTTNREKTIVYILLAFGLLLTLFTSNLLGGLILGMIAGYFFAPEIIYFIRNLGQILGGQDQLRYVILAILAIGFFIEAPGIFIGAVVVAAFKQVITTP